MSFKHNISREFGELSDSDHSKEEGELSDSSDDFFSCNSAASTPSSSSSYATVKSLQSSQPVATQDTQNFTAGFESQPPPNLYKKRKRIPIKKMPRTHIKPQTIPIFAGHLPKIEKIDWNLFYFGNTYFDYVLLYGNIMGGKIKDQNRKVIYIIDDSSGTVKVHFEHHSSEFLESQKNINSLKVRAASIKKTDPQLGCALEARNNWLEKEQTKIEHVFERNSKVLVYGRPFFSKHDDKYHIHAENMTLDDDGSYEQSFHQQLMDQYQKYLK